MGKSKGELTRRDLLQLAVVAAGIGQARSSAADPSTIAAAAPKDNGLYTRRAIEIYTSTLSAQPGETVTLHVSTTARNYDLQFARVGATDEVVWKRSGLSGTFYATPPDAWEKGCGWPAALRIDIPNDWRSGYYEISVTTSDEAEPRISGLAFVVIRAQQPTAKILLVHPTATYGAYNDYGGASLYIKRGNDSRSSGGFIGGERRVSFLRPWVNGFLWKPDNYRFDEELSGVETEDFQKNQLDDHDVKKSSGLALSSNVAGFHNWDRVLVKWLDENGVAADHAISSDLDLHPELLGRYRLMLTVGHDEYWSWRMRDTVERFVTMGGNVCFFSGNLAWQARFEDNGHTMVCYKEAVAEDPLCRSDKPHLTTTLWSSPIVGRPETLLTGVNPYHGGYGEWCGASTSGLNGYLVYRPDHWVFKDSGVSFGDCFGVADKVVHFEVDGCPIRMEDGLPYPGAAYDGPASFEILALCPVSYPGTPSDSGQDVQMVAVKKMLGSGPAYQALLVNRGHAVMGIYRNKGTVFCAGTTDWTNGLKGRDRVVEQVTRNLLKRLSA